MWENPNYKEKIGSFLISEDGTKFAIVGEKYHYIINLENNLRNILTSKIRKSLKPSFYSFKVDKENNITGNYTIYYLSKKNINEKWLKNNGFKNRTKRNNKKYIYTFSGHVNGKRYSANKNINKSFSFNKPYYLKIEEPSSILGNIGKILATPITVAVDGVKTVAGVVFFTAFATTVMVKGDMR